MAINFAEALNTPMNEVERPPLIPVGTYRWVVTKVGSDTIANGAFDVVDFTARIVAPEAVDEDALAAYGDPKGKVKVHRFIFDKEDNAKFETALFRLKTFLHDHLKVDVPEGTPLKQAMAAAINHQFLASVSWRADKNDPNIQYDQIDRTAPLAD